MINKEIIQNKLSDIRGYFAKLDNILCFDSRQIIEDYLKLHTAERMFQLIVDTSVDINSHIISVLNLPVPDDYQNTFITLGENKMLPMDFAVRIAPSVGLRNLVIHKYGKVDIKKMVDDIKNNVGQYREYAKYINDYISKI